MLRGGRKRERRAPEARRRTAGEEPAADGVSVSAAGGCVCRETLSVQKALRPGAGTIHRERRMRSRFSVPQAQCLSHFACPGRRAFCAPRVSNCIPRCPPHSHTCRPPPVRLLRSYGLRRRLFVCLRRRASGARLSRFLVVGSGWKRAVVSR